MIRFLLDTDICIYATRPDAHALRRRLDAAAGQLAMSAITFFDLAYGAYKSAHRDANLANLESMREKIRVLPLNETAAGSYGRLRAELERKGSPIGPHDLLIAAHALSAGLILVTNNVREFSRIPGLKLENWATPRR